MSRRLLIALGGNAIKRRTEEGTTAQQLSNVAITCEQIARLIERQGEGDRIAITHGNGPQVGNLLVQQEAGSGIVPAQEFDVVGSMSQGQIGYMFQQTLQNYLKKSGGDVKVPVIAVVNQVLVSPDDPEFLDPTKPIGNFFSKEEAEELARTQGYVIDPPAGMEYRKEKRTGFVIKRVLPEGSSLKPYRRVVPSPDPIANVEGETIRSLIDQGVVVIASGGGGIPVMKENDNGELKGVFAVIDKDKAGERMAEAIDATDFLVLTDVEHAMLNYGKPDQKPLGEVNLEEAERLLAEGHFLRGSMGPKVEACIRFVKWGGRRATITSLDNAVDAIDGKTGTHIVP
jgi:carbamate kinase